MLDVAEFELGQPSSDKTLTKGMAIIRRRTTTSGHDAILGRRHRTRHRPPSIHRQCRGVPPSPAPSRLETRGKREFFRVGKDGILGLWYMGASREGGIERGRAAKDEPSMARSRENGIPD